MKLTFGKHKGKNIAEVRADYLQWLLTLDNLDKNLRSAINEHLKERYEYFEEICEDFDAFTKEERKSLWIQYYLNP